jgi:AraC-like DNA-binding protein
MHYVARWRMHLARTRLNEDDVTLAEVAEQVGYQSEAAFSRAFKRFMGVSPGSIRRRSDKGLANVRETKASRRQLRR